MRCQNNLFINTVSDIKNDVDLYSLNKLLFSKNDISDNDLDFYTNQLFEHYRKTGYPNYEREYGEELKKFNAIKSIDSNSYYDDISNVFCKNPKFNGFLFSYFPNWIDVQCGVSKSLSECWNDDTKLKNCIRKTLVWMHKHNEGWSENRIRQNSKVFCSGQTVSNFNPVTAKHLYNMYGNCGTILDMCCGWGGRLLGFFGSDCKKYVGYEPCTETYNGLVKLNCDYQNLFGDKEVILNHCGCEDMKIDNESVDFAFTSPPYFDCEKYSYEDTQSWKKYNSKELWVNGFLSKMFENVYRALKNNCYMAINIANTTFYDWIEDECMNKALDSGFIFVEKKFYQLSSISSDKSNKLEPIFIFKKVS